MTIKRVENNAYEIKHLKVDVEVGDRKNHGIFKPKLKLKRWGGECSLDIDFAEDTTDEEIDEELDGKGNITKIKWKAKTPNSELELEYYILEPREFEENGHTVKQLEEGGLEFNIILKNKPTTNNIVLPIKIKGLKFYYQPELTQKEKDKGIFRPENVVGSYAVYHATRTNMHRSKEDAEKYKCGKAFHIYRPKIIDSNGWEVWGELNIANGKMTVTIPQNFLDKAVYPIRHAAGATLGYDTIGSTFSESIEDYPRGSVFNATEYGTIDEIRAYIRDINDYYGINAECAYYDKNEDFVKATSEKAIPQGGDTWYTFDMEVVKPTFNDTDDVWLLCWGEDKGSSSFIIPYDAGDTDQGITNAGPNTYDDWAADFTNGIKEDYKYSIYCIYTPGGPPIPPANPLIGKPLISPDIIKKATIR